MEITTLTTAETKTLLAALPATIRNSSAVRGWLASAESWTERATA